MKTKRCFALLMTVILMVSIVLSNVGTIVFAGDSSQDLPTYNAYEDYSTTDNPNGVWTYQTLSGGTYKNMAYGTTYATMWGNANTGLISTIPGTNASSVTGKSALGLRPEATTTDVVLTFTAPKSGKINVSMANGGVFAPTSTSGSGQIKFTFNHNDTVVKSIDALDSSNNSAAKRFFTDTVELVVAAGDVLRFVVHRNKSVSDTWTYFNPQIQYMEEIQETMPSYNAYEDYSTDSNPNGVWTYQTLSGETYRNETAQDFYGKLAWGAVATGVIVSQSSDKVTGNPVLGLRPEPTTRDVVLTFTAPISGKINVSMANGGVFAPTATSGSVKFTFKHNDTVVKSIDALNSSNSHNNRFFTDTVELTVAAGDSLRFVVHRNAGTNDPWTYFNPQIQYTEEAQEETLPSYNAHTDYATTSNPNGVWTYQTLSGGTYRNETAQDFYGKLAWGAVATGVIVSQSSDKVTGNPVLGLRPEPTTRDVVLTFTAPKSGKINVSMANGGVFAPTATSGSVKFTFKHNDTVVKSIDALNSSNNQNNRFFTDTVKLTVAAGDILRFVVHRNAGTNDPWTYFNPQIDYTEVSDELLANYNAYENYSTSANPNGVWSYQYTASPMLMFNNLDTNKAGTAWENSAAGIIQTGTKNSAPYMVMFPTATRQNVALTFTSPGRGEIIISLDNDKLFTENTDHKSLFTLLHNDTKLIEKAEVTSTGYAFSTMKLNVDVGDEIRFVISRVSSGKAGLTYLNPKITFKAENHVKQDEVIKLVRPANESKVQIVSNSVKEWTDSYDITKTQFSQYMGQDDIYYPGPTVLEWKTKKEANSYVVTYATDEEFSDAKIITTSQSFVNLNNLSPGTDYYWKVEAIYSLGSSTSDVFKFSTTQSRRVVYIDGVSNTRDLGGFTTADGKKIPYGLVYRGAHLNNITELGIEQAISELQIKTDLDLRTAGEDGAGTSSPIGDSINYINKNAPQYALIEQYPSLVKNIIKEFAKEENYPIYYHCQVGRDRTGTISVLLLGLLGVDKEQIYMDYELSAFSYTGGTLGNPSAASMREQFDDLYDYLETYGNGTFTENVEDFLLDCGVTAKEIKSIRNIMLGQTSGTPSVLPSYNAYEEFSTKDNPNGVWTYAHLKAGTYTNLTYNSSEKLWGSAAAGCIKTTTSDLVTGQPALFVRPEPTSTDVVVTFTAPHDGIINISMANGGVFAPHQSSDGITFTLKHNDAIVKKVSDLDSSYSGVGKRFFADDLLRNVKAGDKIHFIVHRNKAVEPSTYFNPLISYEVMGDDALGFPSDAEITVKDLSRNSFTVEWPSATGGTGNYSYTLYRSNEPFNGIPSSGGIKVTENHYTFTDVTYGETYYVMVVVDDGEYQLALEASEPIKVVMDMFTFDAYKDFTSSVQNGMWAYYSTPIGSMKLTPLEWNETYWGNATIGSVKAVSSDLVTGYPALCVDPGVDTDTVVAFIAPYTGRINLYLANGGVFVPYNGAGDNFDGVNFKMLLNDTEKVEYKEVNTKNSHPIKPNSTQYVGRVFTETHEMDIKQGDVIYFVVNKNKQQHNDMTFFNPVVKYVDMDESTLDLRFGGNEDIVATDITKSSMTVHWPMALGGTGNYQYTLYISNSPINQIPASGGIEMGTKTSYEMTDLPEYTDYYFAVVATDGKNTISLIKDKAISTIGNVYGYEAVNDYAEGMQPISTPWRYYWKDLKTGKLNELQWDKDKKQFGTDTTVALQKVSSDLVTGFPALQIIPQQGCEGVIAFIAPFTGEVTIDVTNGGVFAPYNGVPQQYDGVNFKLCKNKKVIYSKKAVSSANSHKDRCFANPITIQVKAGDVLYFSVNVNKKAHMDQTYFAPRVQYNFVQKGSDAFGFLPGATIKATSVGKNSFKLNWSSAFSSSNEKVEYQVWISTSPIKKKPTTKAIYKGSNLACACKQLRYATKYYAYVLATTESGKTDVLNTTDFVMTECPVYDAYLQFTNKNVANVWNYAVRTKNKDTEKYEYTLMTWNDTAKRWGSDTSGMIQQVAKDPVTAKHALAVHPGIRKQDAALVFTAPYSGTVRVSMNNGGVFAPHNGKDQGYDGINFAMYTESKEIWNLDKVSSKNLLPQDRVGTGMVEFNIKQGDKIYFVVNANLNTAADSTYFNPFIEYLEVTGGSGVIDKLEGFIIPEPPKVYPPSFRDNAATETDGLAVKLDYLKTALSPWIWIAIYAVLVVSTVTVITICSKKLIKKP